MYTSIGINKNKYMSNLSKKIKRSNPKNNAYYSFTYNFDEEDDEYYDMMRKKYDEFYNGFNEDNGNMQYAKENNYRNSNKKDSYENRVKDKCVLKKISNCIVDKMDCIQDSCCSAKDATNDSYKNMKEYLCDTYDNSKDCMDDCCDSAMDCMEDCCDSIGDCMDDCCDTVEEYMDDCCTGKMNYMNSAKKAIMVSLGIVAGVAMVTCLMKRKW